MVAIYGAVQYIYALLTELPAACFCVLLLALFGKVLLVLGIFCLVTSGRLGGYLPKTRQLGVTAG